MLINTLTCNTWSYESKISTSLDPPPLSKNDWAANLVSGALNFGKWGAKDRNTRRLPRIREFDFSFWMGKSICNIASSIHKRKNRGFLECWHNSIKQDVAERRIEAEEWLTFGKKAFKSPLISLSLVKYPRTGRIFSRECANVSWRLSSVLLAIFVR